MKRKLFTTGSCRCGAINYAIFGGPVYMAQCHCVDCQKLSGTGHASNAFFKAEDVEVQGDPRGFIVQADSGVLKTYYFCSTCGSRLHGTSGGRPGIMLMPIGCLDDHSWFSPRVVVYTERRDEWDVTTHDVPNFEQMPPKE